MVESRNCAHCTKPIAIPLNALNKRFCSERCRNEYHNARTRKAKELLAQQERQDSGDEL